MTPEQITQLAVAAGFEFYTRKKGAKNIVEVGVIGSLAEFAAAVAAAEREACAKLAAETVCDTHLPTGIKIYGSRAAAAIRKRGEQ